MFLLFYYFLPILKKCFVGLKLTVLCDLNGEIRYVSPLVGAATSDINHMRQQLPVLNELLSPNDEVIVDKVYESLEKDIPNVIVHVKKKKPKGGFLCEEENVKNQEMEKIRKIIETVFGRAKLRFRIMTQKFRMKYKKYSFICPFLVAVAEEVRKYQTDTKAYDSCWNYDVPEVPKRIDKRRGRKKVCCS
jgi:hypothetical protein